MSQVTAAPGPRWRHEVKHVIGRGDAVVLSRRLALLLDADPHAGASGRYRVTSLYFDTPRDDALRDKLEGYSRREKFRLRYYGDDLGTLRLERKAKLRGLCSKDRVLLTEGVARSLAAGDASALLGLDGAAARALYVGMRLHHLAPRSVVRYEREAYTHRAGNVRVTLDAHLEALASPRGFLDPGSLGMPADPGAVVLEVKYDDFLPDVVRAAVQVPRRAVAYSKYALSRRMG